MSLLYEFVLRHLARHWLRALISTLAIALGVAVVISIQMSNAGAVRGFETAIEALSGRAALEIVGHGVGLDEESLTDLRWIGEMGELCAIVEVEAIFRTAEANESLRILGVDILR